MKFFRLYSDEEARRIANGLGDAEWSTGRARTPELTGTVKRNEEILVEKGKMKPTDKWLVDVSRRINNHTELMWHAFPHQIHMPKFSRYVEDSRYHLHTDAPWMGKVRTDLSCTLWLNDDYEGGALKIGDRTFKGQPGECLIYDCGLPHEVLPVTHGQRICAVTWIQSLIRCPHQRSLASRMRQALAKIEDQHDLFVEFGQVYTGLLRMWSERP